MQEGRSAGTEERQLPAPKQTVKKGEKATAVVETSCGTFDDRARHDAAPKTANSFAYLAEEGFYDDSPSTGSCPNS